MDDHTQHPTDELLRDIGSWADRLAGIERSTDAPSTIFTAVHRLYTSGEWVEEWLEQAPEPKRHANNWRADSKSRFANWLRWKLEQQGHQGFGWNYTYKYLSAGEIVAAVPTLYRGTKLSERSVRPFYWMLKNRYEDRLPQVAAAAIESAGSVDALTESHARQAVDGWKKQFIHGRKGGRSRGAITAAATAHRLRVKMREEIAELYRLACIDQQARAEFEGLLGDLDEFLEERAA